MAGVHPDEIYNFIRRPNPDDAAWSHLSYTNSARPRYPGTFPAEVITVAATPSARSARQSGYSVVTSDSRTASMASQSVFDGRAESLRSWAPSSAPSRNSSHPAFAQQFAVENELPPLPLLWCEFYGLPACDFQTDSFSAWTQHHSSHLNGRFPSYTLCWFCDETFVAPASGSSADRRDNFDRRMRHVAEHIRDLGATLDQMRPDFHMVEHAHMHGNGQLDDTTYNKAMQFTELPAKFQLPPDDPDYHSSSAYAPRMQVYNQQREDRHRRSHPNSNKRRR